jgi:predicted acyltransferase (DUF342 family)
VVNREKRGQGELMAVGRISGPLLKANLLRDGVDLAFESDLLYLDVVNGRVGIKTASPTTELEINGTTRTTDLIVDTQADVASFTILDNTISSTNSTINLEPSGSNAVVYQGKIVTGDLQLSTNVIETTAADVDLDINTLGTGKVNINSDVLVNGDVHVTGNITADGDITLGDADTDNITFNADVNSNIIPNVTEFFDLGSENQRWNNTYTKNIVTTTLATSSITANGIDLVLPQGNIIYVAKAGSDSNSGVHEHAPFLTIKHALSEANTGTTVYIYPGVYVEEFPLTVPVGVTVKGAGLRAVTIQPTVETNTNDAFLLNGETTIEDLTITGFFYDSIENTGYGFRFANNFNVTSRSPYMRNVTVLTRGSVTGTDDPYGFDQGDAGRGALFDGSVAVSTSQRASALFQGATFFTPAQYTISATNGVRIEWLNSFAYFADYGIYLVSGSTGFAGTGKTRLRIDTRIGIWAVGNTVNYYAADGITILATGTIASINGNYVELTGKQLGFETITDRPGKTVFVQGNAKLSTVEKKFGTASLVLDGSGDYIALASNPDFAYSTDDFTIEMWVYRTTSSGLVQILLDQRTSAATTYAPVVFINASNQLAYNDGEGTTKISGLTTIPLNEWSHVAVSRSGTSTRLFLNGVQEGSTYTDTRDYIQTPVRIGSRWNDTGYFQGYIDELRISKGVAQYTTNFTPATTEFTGDSSTVLLLHFNGLNNSTTVTDDGITLQDLRTSAGGTASVINFADYSDFGAEMRSIGSANVYGNYGIYGDGDGVTAYLISHNFAYIGSGKLSTNDASIRIQANEVVELNRAKIFYTSVDASGDFRVGDAFFVNQETGEVLFNGQTLNITTSEGVTFTDGTNTTIITPTDITTGNIKIYDNNIDSVTGSIIVTSANDTINLQNNTFITGNLDVVGNVTIGGNITIGDQTTDTINFVAGIGSNLIPAITATYDLGTENLRWNNAYLNRAEIDGVVIDNNSISTTIENDDLTLSANGTGEILVPTSDVQIDQNLTVGQNLTVTSGTTSLQNVGITGTLTQTGDFTQTGNFTTSGDVEVTGNITGTGTLTLPQVTINGSSIAGTELDTDLELSAAGTGRIYIPDNNVRIDNNLSVGGTIEVTGDTTLADVEITGTLTQTGNFNQTGNTEITGTIQSGSITSSGTLTLPEITISDSAIAGTVVDKDVEITANGTGEVLIPNNNVRIDNDLSVGGTLEVSGVSTLASVGITGTLTQTGDLDQTGNFTTSGTVGVTGDTTLGASITIPNITISGSSITTNANNLNLVLTAQGTGQVIIQDLGINGTTITGQTSGSDITISPAGGGVVINSVKSLVIPAGATSDRPTVGTNGMIRYNTSLDRYEGFANGNWVALAGIQSLTGSTRITPELTPGEGDNTIRFYANNTLVSTIDSTKLYTISLETDDLNISNNTISAIDTDTDINFTTTGTGGVVVGDLKFRNSEITNTVSGGITQFNTTGTGYVKVAGTFGTVIPRGTVANRPLAANSEIGMMRYNSDLQFVEIWNGTIWENVAASSGGINLVDATSLSIVNAIVFG